MRVLIDLKVVNLKFSSLSDANLSTVNQIFLVRSGSRLFSLLWGFIPILLVQTICNARYIPGCRLGVTMTTHSSSIFLRIGIIFDIT